MAKSKNHTSHNQNIEKIGDSHKKTILALRKKF